MKKKAIAIAGAGVGIILLIGVLAVAFSIDTIARAAVEKGAGDAMGVTTTLDAANVRLFAGTFSMRGLTVENPPAFAGDPFLTLNEGSVAVSLGTLRKETIELPHLRLTGLGVDIQRRRGESNYGVILSNMKKDRDEQPAPSQTDAGPDFVVGEVTIRDVNVRVSLAPIGGEPSVVTIPIREIALTNVGADKPMPLGTLAGVIVQAVLAAVVEEGGALLPADLAGDLRGALDQLGSLGDLGVGVATQLGDEARKMLEGAGDKAKDAAEGIKDAAEDAKKSIENLGKGLLPGNKKPGG